MACQDGAPSLLGVLSDVHQALHLLTRILQCQSSDHPSSCGDSREHDGHLHTCENNTSDASRDLETLHEKFFHTLDKILLEAVQTDGPVRTRENKTCADDRHEILFHSKCISALVKILSYLSIDLAYRYLLPGSIIQRFGIYTNHGGCQVRALAEQSGERRSGYTANDSTNKTTWFGANDGSHICGERGYKDTGTAARFYYCAKSSPSERHKGLDDFYWVCDKQRMSGFRRVSRDEWEQAPKRQRATGNIHPTVKPLEILRYIATLLLPPERETPRRLLVPFCGSGSEVLAALQAGWDEVVGIDMVDDYLAIARARVKHWDITGAVDVDAPLFNPPSQRQEPVAVARQRRLF